MSDNYLVLHVHNTSICIEGKFEKGLYKQFKKTLGYYPEDAIFRMKMSEKKSAAMGRSWSWDGLVSTVCYNKHYCRCPIKKDGTHFPTGLLGRARGFLRKYNVPHKFIDERKPVEHASLDLSMSEDFEIRPYQQEIVKKAITSQRGVIKAATGSGKTSVAAQIIAEADVSPFVFYVPSIDLLIQAKNELTRFIRSHGSNLKVGALGGGFCDIQDITVMTIQTAVRATGEKYVQFDDEDKLETGEFLDEDESTIKDLIMSAKGYISDEIQFWSCESCQAIADYSVSAYYRWGLSATPYRDRGDDLLIDACFGKVIADINASYLIKEGYLVKPNIYFIPMKHPKYNGQTFQSIYKAGITENSTRNACIAAIAKRYADQGRTILVLCRHIAHGETLKELIEDSVFLHGQHSGKDREEHLDKMREKQAPVTIASVIFDQGIDCRPLDTLILAGSGKSVTRALQRVGRTLRPYPGKTHSIVVDFQDKCKYLSSHNNKRRKIYSTEPEFSIEDLEIS